MTVPRETTEAIARFIDELVSENRRQNLVAASTLDEIADRHVADSLQLLSAISAQTGHWIDIGTGAGFPGLIVAIAAPAWSVTLVEPRTLRAQFLQRMVDMLDLAPRVRVVVSKIEHVHEQADVISARAVARLDRLFAMAAHLATPTTCWLLLKGRQAAEEVAEAQRSWQGTIRLKPSATSPEAAIVVAENVRRKERRR